MENKRSILKKLWTLTKADDYEYVTTNETKPVKKESK